VTPAVIIWSAIAAMAAVCAVLYLTLVDRPEPRHAARRADDEAAAWMHQLVGPARVMAPVPPAVQAGITALVLAARNVSGPAPASPGPSPLAPPAAAAGPETLRTLAIRASGELPHPVPILPPPDQAAHLQPIDWADETGSFAAICGVDQ